MPIKIFSVNHRTSNSMYKDGSYEKMELPQLYIYIHTHTHTHTQEVSLKHIVKQ